MKFIAGVPLVVAAVNWMLLTPVEAVMADVFTAVLPLESAMLLALPDVFAALFRNVARKQCGKLSVRKRACGQVAR